MACWGKQTGAAVSLLFVLLSKSESPDMLLFDKLPLAPLICYRLIHHVLITLFPSLQCVMCQMSEVWFQGERSSSCDILRYLSPSFISLLSKWQIKDCSLWDVWQTDKAERLVFFFPLVLGKVAALLKSESLPFDKHNVLHIRGGLCVLRWWPHLKAPHFNHNLPCRLNAGSNQSWLTLASYIVLSQ